MVQQKHNELTWLALATGMTGSKAGTTLNTKLKRPGLYCTGDGNIFVGKVTYAEAWLNLKEDRLWRGKDKWGKRSSICVTSLVVSFCPSNIIELGNDGTNINAWWSFLSR